ncbi:hypothetical protein L9F63_026019, partial [Diploptera punctata]
ELNLKVKDGSMNFDIPDEHDLISKFIESTPDGNDISKFVKSTPDGNVIEGDSNEYPDIFQIYNVDITVSNQIYNIKAFMSEQIHMSLQVGGMALVRCSHDDILRSSCSQEVSESHARKEEKKKIEFGIYRKETHIDNYIKATGFNHFSHKQALRCEMISAAHLHSYSAWCGQQVADSPQAQQAMAGAEHRQDLNHTSLSVHSFYNLSVDF